MGRDSNRRQTISTMRLLSLFSAHFSALCRPSETQSAAYRLLDQRQLVRGKIAQLAQQLDLRHRRHLRRVQDTAAVQEPCWHRDREARPLHAGRVRSRARRSVRLVHRQQDGKRPTKDHPRFLDDAVAHGEWPDDAEANLSFRHRQVHDRITKLRVNWQPGHEIFQGGEKGRPVSPRDRDIR